MTPGSLFLDFDGTLCDSLPAMQGAYRSFLQWAGPVEPVLTFDEINGPPLRQVVEMLKARHGFSQAVEILMGKYGALAEEAHAGAGPAAGAATLLSAARSGGWRIFVVTSASKRQVAAWLGNQGFTEAVSGIIGGDDVSNGKPDPEPYLAALALSGGGADRAVAVEDSAQGARSALAAGIRTWLLAKEPPNDFAGTDLFMGAVPNLEAVADRLPSVRTPKAHPDAMGLS